MEGDFFDYADCAERRIPSHPLRTPEWKGLGIRAVKVLKRNGCESLADAVKLSKMELLGTKDCGPTTFHEIVVALRNAGLTAS